MQDNEEFGSDTIFTLASLHPNTKSGGSGGRKELAFQRCNDVFLS